MTTLRVLLHVAAQRDYELNSLDLSTAFLHGSLHEEIWLRRPPGFTRLFPAGTQWSLRRLVYSLRQAPREWHDTLRTTHAALGFAPSTADPSLFLRTDTSLPPFYVLVYIDDLVFATADTKVLALVKSELQKRHTCTDLGELRSYLGLWITWDRARRTITLTQSHMVHQVLQRFRFQFSSPHPTPLSTSHLLSAPPSDESVEPSGPYPEFVGCLMYLMMCPRPDLAYPLMLLAAYVAPGRHRKVHWDAVKRLLRYLCSTSGMWLVLGGRGPVVLTGHADASWVDDSATQRSSQGYTFSLGSGSVSWRSTHSSSVLSSSCEAEIYAGAMAAQELRWLTYLLTDLGEQPRSPPQCGQLCLAYVASRANTADTFTKALPPGDHQRFSTVLGLMPTLPTCLLRDFARTVICICTCMLALARWYLKLRGVLEEIGFTPSTADHSLFMLGEGEQRSFMVVYVDDILIFSPSSDLVKEVMLKVQDKFKCKALGDVSFYLGLHIERDVEKRCMRVHQRKYLETLAANFGQSEGHVATPFPSGFKCVKGPEEESVGEEERRRFHSLVGSLMYVAVNTRPDVAFATGQLARVVQCPNEEQVAAGMRVAKYLGQTPTVGLQYSAAAQRRQKGADGVESGRLFLTAFSYASFASEPEDMTSVGWFICCVGGGPTAWESKKQVDQALSSVESEYMALFRAVREIVWQRRLLAELGEEEEGPTPLYCDCQGAIALAKNLVLHGLTKHMRVKWHWTRSMVAAGEVELHYVKTTGQPADMMTKRLVEQQHWKCCKLVGMALN
ncbi:unnamed protein product [Closterium sp. NIES-53]